LNSSIPSRLISTSDARRCTKVITAQTRLNQTGVDVISDGVPREPIAITRAIFGNVETWKIVVPAECESARRDFSVRFQPSGSWFSEVANTITITEPPAKKRRPSGGGQ
jgi:hypothetical protein